MTPPSSPVASGCSVIGKIVLSIVVVVCCTFSWIFVGSNVPSRVEPANGPKGVRRGASTSSAAMCFSFEIVTCTTLHDSKAPGNYWHHVSFMSPNTTTASQLTRSTNICVGKKWSGFKMKPQQYAEYALSVSRNRRADGCEAVLIFIDGDVIINNEIDVEEMQKRWISFGTDVVISTEMSCWMGFICLEKDVKRFYKKQMEKDQLEPDQASPSPFVNSGAFMGKATALADIFSTSPNYPEFDLDDQKLVTEWLLGDWSIATDTTQKIFGSTLYAQPFTSPFLNRSVCPSPPIGVANFSCMSIPGSRFVAQQCCSNADIDKKTQLHMFPIVEHGPHACAIIRHSGMHEGVRRKDAAMAPPEQFWATSFSRLETRPLFWHGNGPGKSVWTALAKRARRCRGVLWASTEGSLGSSAVTTDTVHSGVYVKQGVNTTSHEDYDLIVDFIDHRDPRVNYAGAHVRARTWLGASVFGPYPFKRPFTTFWFRSNGEGWLSFKMIDSMNLRQDLGEGLHVVWRRVQDKSVRKKHKAGDTYQSPA